MNTQEMLAISMSWRRHAPDSERSVEANVWKLARGFSEEVKNAPQVVTPGAKRTLLGRVRWVLLAQHSLEILPLGFLGMMSVNSTAFGCLASEFVLAEREDFVPGQSRVGFHQRRGIRPTSALF